MISQPAIDAACEAYRHPKRMITNTSDGAHHDRMTAALEAAMPHIRTAIDEEIRLTVRDPEAFSAMVSEYSVDYANGYYTAIEDAARIAEKGTEQ